MTTIERAALPPMKRGRKPKGTIRIDEPSSTTVYFSTPSSVEDGWVSKAFRDSSITEVGNADGWTGSIERTVLPKPVTVTTRFPPEGLELLMGGPFNGEYRDMRNFANDFFAIFGEEESLEVHYYERGDVFGWVWAASVYPDGIELRERYDV